MRMIPEKNIKKVPGYPDAELVLDANKQELTQHGTGGFPCACYLDRYQGTFFPWHWHDELEIALVQKGTLSFAVNEQRYTLSAGEGLFVNSGVLHAYAGAEGEESVIPNIVFHPALIYGTQQSVFWSRYMRPILSSATLSHLIFKPEIPWQREALGHLRTAYELGIAQGNGFELKMRSHLSELMLLIFEHSSDAIAARSAPLPQELNRVRRMIDFIDCHYAEPVTLSQIAGAAAVSERECLRCFRNVIGQTPKQYVIRRRIQYASDLLLHSNRSLMEIGELCGFQSQSYFIKIFHRAVGMPPGEFRRRGTPQK